MPNQISPYSAQQEALDRQRALAQAMMQQAYQPMEMPDTPGAAASPLAGIAKMLQIYLAQRQNKKLDKQQEAINQQMLSDRSSSAERMAQALVPQAPPDQVTLPPVQGTPLPESGPTMQNPPTPQSMAGRDALVKAFGGALGSYDPMQQKMAEALTGDFMAQRKEGRETSSQEAMARLVDTLTGKRQANQATLESQLSAQDPLRMAQTKKLGEPTLGEISPGATYGSVQGGQFTPQGTAAPTPRGPLSVDQQVLSDWLSKNPGKGPAEFMALKAALGRPPNTAGADRETRRTDSSYQFETKRIDDIAKPVTDRLGRLQNLEDSLAQNSPQADALIAPELLTVMAGGQGSGLRMNEAEISRIVGGRNQWESLKSAALRWQTDPTKPFLITPAQRAQIGELMKTVKTKLGAKQTQINDARRKLIDAATPESQRRITQELQDQLGAPAPSTGFRIVP